MASLDELVTKLKEIFQTDRADLYFLNSRSAEQAIAPANPAQLHRVKTS